MDEISSPGNGIRSRIEGGRLPEKMILRKVLFLGLSMVFLFMSGCQSTQWKPLISPIAVDINATINSQTGGGEVINPIDPDLKKNDIPFTQTLTPISPDLPMEMVATEPIESLCLSASAGIPMDVTIPDGTRLKSGEVFTKIWRLENNGTCIWTPEYLLVWFSGFHMGVLEKQISLKPVAPGDVIDIAVDMQAPDEPGIFWSYWKIKSPDDIEFGIGPGADAPIWVNIEVIDENYATPNPTMEPTFSSTENTMDDEIFIKLLDRIDLDHGLVNPDDGGDIILDEKNGNGFIIYPLLNILTSHVGKQEPTLDLCTGVEFTSTPVELTEEELKSSWCYKTDLGLTGYFTFLEFHSGENSGILIKFKTWIVP